MKVTITAMINFEDCGKEVAVTSFKVLRQNFYGRTERNRNKPVRRDTPRAYAQSGTFHVQITITNNSSATSGEAPKRLTPNLRSNIERIFLITCIIISIRALTVLEQRKE
jgi:hypothetical protein